MPDRVDTCLAWFSPGPRKNTRLENFEMRKNFILCCVAGAALIACSSGKSETKERIKITQPAPVKGQKANAWDMLHDSWGSDADRDLARDVRQALTEDPDVVPFADAVAAEVSGGSVVLRGSGAYTLNLDEWQTVGRRVKAVKGVKSVEIKSRVSSEG
jgi:hypothetical protein